MTAQTRRDVEPTDEPRVPTAGPAPTALPAAQIRTAVDIPISVGTVQTRATMISFDDLVDLGEHVALRFDGPALRDGSRRPPLVRPHSECLTGDVFGSLRCDCGPQLHEAIHRIAEAGGYILYLRQEGRGIGLYNKLDAYLLQDQGLDTYQANLALNHSEDERDYTVAAQMLFALGVPVIRLLSNNPDKARQLDRLGITVEHQIPTGLHLSAENRNYLATKARRGAHRFSGDADLPI
ncbi:GTP cyclohydrolase II [Microlunatus sp. Gsoil 973]|uniref:GTP cyclohydrolase II n=1 Tax=Microlunatus sp. Gsoil 973 TaxID=2672569 RepID=UPI0012B4D62F|nr:GTP cyclohydrolase II [Microlunatus sp. Gsoil 973]QGN34303.1 GTP cyclohydrolase II RibA [Microlunatus sp. Gsoil 973]